MNKTNKVSPYKLFKEWLLNPYPKAELSDEVLKSINPKSILHMFGSMGGITIYLDEYFNNFGLMYCNPLEFYNFLKQLVQKYKIGRYDFSFFASMKMDKTIQELHRKFPMLKQYEIYDLLDRCKDDEENEAFLESLGLNKKPKIIKEKKNKPKKKILKEAATFDDIIIKGIKTMKELEKLFNLEGKCNE